MKHLFDFDSFFTMINGLILRRWGYSLFLSILLFWGIGMQSAGAENITPPETCRVGIYIQSLRDFNFAEKSFTADFRLWSVCPNDQLKPLDTIEIIDATSVDSTYENRIKRPNLSEDFSSLNQVIWSQKKFSTVIYYNWNVDNYPFDRHRLKIPLEEALLDKTNFVYTPDFTNSGYQKNMKLSGWEITNFSLAEETASYVTNFGDPELAQKQGNYSRLVVTIDIQRVKFISFFKLTAGVYAAFCLSCLSFFYDSDQTSLMSARTGLLVGCLFAVLVNMRALESVLGRTEGLTLVDQIHISTMIYIFAASVLGVYSRLMTEEGKRKWVLKFDRTILFRVFLGSFIVLNVVIISYAAIVG